MGDGEFDTLTVSGKAQADSLAVTNAASLGSLTVGSHKRVSIDPTSADNAVCLQARQTLIPLPGHHDPVVEKLIPLALQPEGENVGIGTSSPSMPLHVISKGTQLLLLQSTTGGISNSASLNFQTYGAAGSPPFPTASISAIDNGNYSSHLAFLTKRPGQDKNGQSERMRITSDGNVGIGTINPSTKLDVKGDIRINDNKIWLRGDKYHGLGFGGNAFANSHIDGPVLFGFDGGALGTTNPSAGGQKIALSWKSNGDINVSGNINVAGDITLQPADVAEDFSVADEENVEDGTVMVLQDDGTLQESQKAYDKRVVGIISGAGNYRPGIILDKQSSLRNRRPIALVGKAYCKVDAERAAIQVGDLLTTSPTAGHAMKASDPVQAFGAVIGKALSALPKGRGMIPVLIALQ